MLLDLILREEPIKKIAEAIEKLMPLELEAELNSPDLDKRPLHAALQNRAGIDVVKLLLDANSQIIKGKTEAYLNQRAVNNDVERKQTNQIRALLELYAHLQIADFPMNQTLAFCREGMKNLAPFRKIEGHEIKEAVTLMGATGRGKSTLFNVMHQQQYEAIVDVETDETILTLMGDGEEFAKSSSMPRSTTNYPLIKQLIDNAYLVDLPGHNDTREGVVGEGLARKISIGLSTRSLSDCFTHVRALVFVVLESDLKGRAEVFQDTLKALSKIVHGDERLLRNVILVVNQTPEAVSAVSIIKRIKRIGEANPGFNKDIKFVIDNLNEAQITLIKDVPGAEFRQQMLDQIAALHPQAFEQFDFNCYNTEAETFSHRLTERLDEFATGIKKEISTILEQATNQLLAVKTMLTEKLQTPLMLNKIGNPVLEERRLLIVHRCKEQLEICNKMLSQEIPLEFVNQPVDDVAETLYLRKEFLDELRAQLSPIMKERKAPKLAGVGVAFFAHQGGEQQVIIPPAANVQAHN
jgi:hypothetical protein